MDFTLTDTQQEYRNRAREFRAEHEERIMECKRRSEYPHDLFEKGIEYGFPGLLVPEEYGGAGLGAVEYALVAEEIGLYQTTYQLARALMVAGTDDQKERYLPELAAGNLVGSDDISEPDAGSSLTDIQTTAERDGDEWVINGQKTHVNSAEAADVHHVYTHTDEGLTVFLVEKDNPGMRIGEKHDPIGLREMPINDVHYEDCVVPDDQMLGENGGGYEVFFKTFNFSRIGNASEILGHGKRTLETAIEWASEREVGDQGVVTDFQGNRWKIAELKTRLRGVEHIRNEAAWQLDQGNSAVKLTSMAKLRAGEVALAAIEEAIQLTGAHGLYREQGFDMAFADAKTLDVAGGSREIMRNVIADQILD
ncbi:MAG: acyl-CoA dehydrogenase family protein [Halorientalis sp.]